jgi:hypothetical protein
MGRAISGHKFIRNAAEFLTASYEREHQFDSAYFYSKVADASRDSLFSEEKVRQIQSLRFEEQLRQRELAAAQEAAVKERGIKEEARAKKVGNEVGDTCPLCNNGTIIEAGGCHTCDGCNAQLRCGL